jgi:hypothetical protein
LFKKGEKAMDASTVRIVCAVAAILFIGIIALRRKKGTEE